MSQFYQDSDELVVLDNFTCQNEADTPHLRDMSWLGVITTARPGGKARFAHTQILLFYAYTFSFFNCTDYFILVILNLPHIRIAFNNP